MSMSWWICINSVFGRGSAEFLFIGLAEIANVLEAAGEGGVFCSGFSVALEEIPGVGQPQVQNVFYHCAAKGLFEIVAQLGHGDIAQCRQLLQCQLPGEVLFDEEGDLLGGGDHTAGLVFKKIHIEGICIGREQPLPLVLVVFPEDPADIGQIFFQIDMLCKQKGAAFVMQ